MVLKEVDRSHSNVVVVVILGLAIALGRLLAPYVTRVFACAPSRFDRVLNPIESLIFKLGGVNPTIRWVG